MFGIYLFLAIIALLVFGIIAIYNKLVRGRNLVAEGWSGIDVQLKRRTDLIPNLLESVKGYMSHERGLLSEVTRLRSESMQVKDVTTKSQLENALSRSLANLFAVAENYPDLKANQNFIDLQRQLGEIEDQIQMARRYYNGTVRNYNILIESFPSNLIAQKFQFKQASFFELDNDSDRAVPRVNF
ncbi:MAG TPA: LemA family protein [bacterium]|nr:LemA family protein [bacterium]